MHDEYERAAMAWLGSMWMMGARVRERVIEPARRLTIEQARHLAWWAAEDEQLPPARRRAARQARDRDADDAVRAVAVPIGSSHGNHELDALVEEVRAAVQASARASASPGDAAWTAAREAAVSAAYGWAAAGMTDGFVALTLPWSAMLEGRRAA